MRADLSKLTFPTVLFYLEPDFFAPKFRSRTRQECRAPNEAAGTDARRAGSREWDRDDEILPIQAEFIDRDHRMLGTRLTTGRRAHRGYRYSKFFAVESVFVGDGRT